jgi:Leucine-rich repeat (LRR) protein
VGFGVGIESNQANFFIIYSTETLRALYLGDNDFEYLPIEIKNLKNLQIVRPSMALTHHHHHLILIIPPF